MDAERAEPGPNADGADQGPAVFASTALTLLVLLAAIALPPQLDLGLFFVLSAPIALIAGIRGLGAGLLAAGIGLGCFAVWDAANDAGAGAGAYAVRGVTFVAVASVCAFAAHWARRRAEVRVARAQARAERWERARVLSEGIAVYAFIRLDRDAQVLAWGESARRLFGWDEAEILGKHVSALFHDEGAGDGFAERALGGALQEGLFDERGELVRKSGECFPAHVILTAVAGPSGGYLLAVADIGRQEAAERALARTTTQLGDVEQVAGLGTWRWEADTGQVLLSDQALSVFGLGDGHRVSDSEAMMARLHAEDREAIRRTVEEAIQHRRPFRHEIRIVHDDGSVRLAEIRGEAELDGGGQPVWIRGTAQDTTDTFGPRHALHEAELDLAGDPDGGPPPLALIEAGAGPPHRLRHVNRALCELVGQSRTQLVAMDLAELVEPLPPALLSGEGSSAATHLKRGKGESVPVGLTASPLWTETGHAYTLLQFGVIPHTGEGVVEVSRIDGLNERELEVLRLVSEGCTGREIAGRLHISPETVKSRLSLIYQKLEVPDRAAAVATAIRRGLID